MYYEHQEDASKILKIDVPEILKGIKKDLSTSYPLLYQ
jgi:hypothetical protein